MAFTRIERDPRRRLNKRSAPTIRQKANNDKRQSPRIALVTVSYYDNKPQKYDRFTDHFLSKACFASRHGYDFYLDTFNRLPDGLHPKFAKTFLSMQLLDKYDWLYFTDDDVLMNSFDYKLENIIEGFGDVDIHLIVPKDKVGPDNLQFSNYAFMIRNSDFGRTLLQDWFHSFQTCQLAKPFRNWPDQSNMWLMIVKNVYQYYNLTVPTAIQQVCWENTTTVDGQDLIGIFKDSLRKLGFTTAQSITSERTLQAPVAWSEVDQGNQLGLGIQRNHNIILSSVKKREKQEATELRALSIHVKDEKNSSRFSVLPHFRNNMTQCFDKFHVPNMTIVEQNSMSNEFVPIQNIKNMKLFASMDEFRFGHRRSLHSLAPARVCIQQTSNLLQEGPNAAKALELMVMNMLSVPSGVQLKVSSESCTNYKDVKWDYKRHTVQGTSNFESETWKILFYEIQLKHSFRGLHSTTMAVDVVN